MDLETTTSQQVTYPDVHLHNEDPLQTEVLWQRQPSISELRAQLLSEQGQALISNDEAKRYKNRYGNIHGNSINCVIKYLREGAVFTEENLDNRITAATEKPRRKATGELNYSLAAYDNNWQIPVLEAIYSDGITSTQVPQGEESRNYANQLLYEQAKQTRANGDFDSIILELSPTPEVLTEELVSRGYDGYHVVFGWQYDPITRKENVQLYWLKKDTSHSQFEQLIEQLPTARQRQESASLPPDLAMSRDVEIMLASGAVSRDYFHELVMPFVEEHRIPNTSPELTAFIEEDITRSVLTQVLPLINEAAELVLAEIDTDIDNSDRLSLILAQIEDYRAGYEYLTYLRLDELSGTNSVQKHTSIFSASEFAALDQGQQIAVMKLNEFESSYCGGQRSFRGTLIPGFGETSSASLAGADSADHNLCVRCLLHNIISYGPVGKCNVGLACCQGYYDGGIYE